MSDRGSLYRASRNCPTQYRHATKAVNRMPVLRRVIPDSAPQRHPNHDGGGGGQRCQPHVGQHAETPLPHFSPPVPGRQTTRIFPHDGDSTGTMFREEQVTKFKTPDLVGESVGVPQRRRESVPGFRGHVLLVQPGSDGVRIISDDVPRHEAAERFLDGSNHALTLRAGNSSRQSGLYSSFRGFTTRSSVQAVLVFLRIRQEC